MSLGEKRYRQVKWGIGSILFLIIYSTLFYIFLDLSFIKSSREYFKGWLDSEAVSIQEGNLLTSVSKFKRVIKYSDLLIGTSLTSIDKEGKLTDIITFGKVESHSKVSLPTSDNISANRTGVFGYQLIYKIPNKKHMFLLLQIQPRSAAATYLFNLGSTLAIFIIFLVITLFIKRQEEQKRHEILKEFLEVATSGVTSDQLLRIKQTWPKLSENTVRLVHTLNQMTTRLNESTRYEAIAQTTQMLAHDVRKPFTLLQTLIKSVTSSVSIKEAQLILSESIPEVNRALASVQGMLQDIMEVDKASPSMQIESISPIDLIHDGLSSVLRFHEYQNLYISSEINSSKKVVGDRHKLNRVFSNIITNAIEHMNGTGQIWFSCEKRQEMIEFVIGNSNTFITEEVREKLFEAFYTSGKKEGTGLGLAISKKIIEAHGGKIWCHSDIKKGTEFIFLLPHSDLDDDSPTKIYSSAREYFNNNQISIQNLNDSSLDDTHLLQSNLNLILKKTMKCAIIDDEKTYRAYLDQCTRDLTQVKIAHFKSSEDFFEHLKIESFDIIILDVDFGPNKLMGFTACKKIRHLLPNSKICIHSNRGAIEYQAKAISSGADAFCPKPMSKAYLIKLIASAVDISEDDLYSVVDQLKISKNIMVVEDDRSLLRRWKKILGDQAIYCKNYHEFESQYTEMIDLVITDYYLEGAQTGADIAKVIEANIPIYLCSGIDDIPDEVSQLFTGVLPKSPDEAYKKLITIQSLSQD